MPQSRLSGLEKAVEKLVCAPKDAPTRFDLYDLEAAVNKLSGCVDSDKLKDEIANLADEVVELKNVVDNQKDHVKELTHSLDGLHDQIGELRSEIKELIAAIQRTTKE